MPRSDNLYGWVKIAGENLGFVFACGRFGEPVENVHIRIGMADSMAASDALDDPTTFRRDLGAYLSPNDLRQLFIKAVETPDIRNEDGIPFPGVLWHLEQHARLLVDRQRPEGSLVMRRRTIRRSFSPI